MSSIKQTFSCFNDDISKEVSEPIIDHKEISQPFYVNMLVHEKRDIESAISPGQKLSNEKLKMDAPLKSVARFFATLFLGSIPAIALIDGGANINCIHPRILDE